MHYKTICLELLQQNPRIWETLRKNRSMMATLEFFSGELKSRHEAWKTQFTQERPGSAPSQIASEALEMALQEIEDHLSSAFPPAAPQPLSLDEAMAFIRRHTPPA